MKDKIERLVIVGGVAGGASCAARARRLSEETSISIFEKGPYVSFANCGLPYYVGDVITDEQKLLVASPGLFKQRFNIDVHLESEVIQIDSKRQFITVRNLKTGRDSEYPYDALVLATGAQTFRPPLPGIDLPGIFSVRTIPDTNSIKEWMDNKNVDSAIIAGGGFIGLEMAENLINLGLKVTLIESSEHVLAPLDAEMAEPVHERLLANDVDLVLNSRVASFEKKDGKILATTENGDSYSADLAILALGIRPASKLAKDIGLKLGVREAVAVDQKMKTSNSKIWAVGDLVEVNDFVTKQPINIALAGPANRQGRIAADSIFGLESKFRGIQGTFICGLFELTVAATGVNERTLKLLSIDYDKVYLYPGHHAGYYPNAKKIEFKLMFSPTNGKILGAQAVGEEGIDKRIDIVATAIQAGMTVFDLEESELCYAPQFGAAKDPINIAGMIAANALRKDAPLAHWENINSFDGVILDVREKAEFESEHINNAINIPLSVLRSQMDQLPKDKDIWVYCRVGQRGYYGTRALRLNGYSAYNLTGGMTSYSRIKTVVDNKTKNLEKVV